MTCFINMGAVSWNKAGNNAPTWILYSHEIATHHSKRVLILHYRKEQFHMGALTLYRTMLVYKASKLLKVIYEAVSLLDVSVHWQYYCYTHLVGIAKWCKSSLVLNEQLKRILVITFGYRWKKVQSKDC